VKNRPNILDTHVTEEFIESQFGDIREKAAGVDIPGLTPELISKTLHRVHQVTRTELLGIFGDYSDVGLSIDGVTFKCRKSLDIDVGNPVSDPRPFTYHFFKNNTFDTAEFTHYFAHVMNELKNGGMSVAGVTSDG
jgi:hypothetical protein